MAGQNGISQLTSFSYPFGALNQRSREVVATEYGTARSTWTGVNRGRFDAAALRAVPLMTRDRPALAFKFLTEFLEHDGWLVFYTHDVSETASVWGCQPALLARLVEVTLNAGVELLPIRDVQF